MVRWNVADFALLALLHRLVKPHSLKAQFETEIEHLEKLGLQMFDGTHVLPSLFHQWVHVLVLESHRVVLVVVASDFCLVWTIVEQASPNFSTAKPILLPTSQGSGLVGQQVRQTTRVPPCGLVPTTFPPTV